MTLYQSVIQRRLQPELMDQPDISAQRHRQALRGLGRINFWSCSAQILWHPLLDLQKELGRPMRVLDLACGGGDVICRLARKARRDNVAISFAGCDKSATAIEFAQQNARHSGVQVEFLISDVVSNSLPTGFDVVMTSLFLHHLNEERAQDVLRKMADATGSLVLVNDLIRSRSGLLLAQLGTRILSFSPVVHHDGPRSVEGAYTCEEVERIAATAGLAGATVKKCWPQRFLLSWRKPQ